jgi:hypothetical protein
MLVNEMSPHIETEIVADDELQPVDVEWKRDSALSISNSSLNWIGLRKN